MAAMTVDELVTQLRAAYGADLRAIVLYGSAASGEHEPKRSDTNVLVLVEELGVDRLRAASAASRAWADAGNPAPLTMTVREWRGSSDIFPMEYADILDRHRVLFGELPVDGIMVEPSDLRLQLEQEAMGKLLRLRQGVLASGGEARRQAELLEASKSAVMVLFRATLRLIGQRPPAENVALSRAVASAAGFDAAPFERVLQHARGEKRIGDAEGGSVISGYLAGVERLVQFLDQFGAAS